MFWKKLKNKNLKTKFEEKNNFEKKKKKIWEQIVSKKNCGKKAYPGYLVNYFAL